ncbi:MAG: hypothetical protein ACM3ZQ_06075 [Bacillota bacterium]
MPTIRRWFVVFIIIGLFLLYNLEFPITADERRELVEPYQTTYEVYQVQAHYHNPHQIKVSILATPHSGGPAERIGLIYDRESRTVLAVERGGFGTPLVKWSAQFIAVFALLAFWLLYLDPLLAGRYCPSCRTFGIFPLILREKETTLYPAVLSDDGDYTPEIIEKEQACPRCSFRSYTVREQSALLQGNILTELKGSINVHQSVERSEQDVKELEQRVKTKGISRSRQQQRPELAKASAAAKSTPRA